MRHFIIIGLLAFMGTVLLTSCGSDTGLFGTKDTDSDTGGSTEPEPNPNPDPGTPATPADVAGKWLAVYHDERIANTAENGAQQYIAEINVTQNSGDLSGEGNLARVFNEGDNLADFVPFTLTGTVVDHDVEMTLTASELDGDHQWYLRKTSGDKMVGFYTVSSNSGAFIRSGHAVLRLRTVGTPLMPWVSAASDSFTYAPHVQLDRTALLDLDETDSTNVIGSGVFTTQTAAHVSLEQRFQVTRGGIDSGKLFFSLGGLNLASMEMDWFAMHDKRIMVAAYAQYNTSAGTEGAPLISYGNALWRQAMDSPLPIDLRGDWVGAFSDTRANLDTAQETSSYLMRLSFGVLLSGGLSGSAKVIDAERNIETVYSLTMSDIDLQDTQLRFILSNAQSPMRFEFDLRIAENALVGTYLHFDTQGEFVSQGRAEFFEQDDTPQLQGTWTASHFDTRAVFEQHYPQLAIMTISEQDAADNLTGLGVYRLADEADLLNDVTLSGLADTEFMTWSVNTGPAGEVVTWRLLSAKDRLVGAYASGGTASNPDTLGYAQWFKTGLTESFE